MARKFKSVKLLTNLWQSGSSQAENKPRLANPNYESYCKKAVDNFCLKVDLCEDLHSYTLNVCEGMIDLIAQGIPKQAFIEHPLAFSKLIRFGEDIIENTNTKSDMFYLGVFIELKIAANWFRTGFYNLIQDILVKILERGKAIPESIKTKIEELAFQQNYTMFQLYFKDSKFLSTG